METNNFQKVFKILIFSSQFSIIIMRFFFLLNFFIFFSRTFRFLSEYDFIYEIILKHLRVNKIKKKMLFSVYLCPMNIWFFFLLKIVLYSE